MWELYDFWVWIPEFLGEVHVNSFGIEGAI
jgi:hypothetical protein